MADDGADNAIRISDLFANILHTVFSRQLISELSDKRVSLAQVQALRFIWLHNTVRIGDLADGMGVSYPSATNMVSRLGRLGLAERLVNPGDRREVQARLTVSGITLARRMEEERTARITAIMNLLPTGDRAALERGLTAFVVAAAGDPGLARDVCLRCGSLAADDCPVAQQHGRHMRD